MTIFRNNHFVTPYAAQERRSGVRALRDENVFSGKIKRSSCRRDELMKRVDPLCPGETVVFTLYKPRDRSACRSFVNDIRVCITVTGYRHY